MPVEKIDSKMYKDFVIYLRAKIHNDVSINFYLRDLITILHFFMNEGWLPHFKMQAIKGKRKKYCSHITKKRADLKDSYLSIKSAL